MSKINPKLIDDVFDDSVLEVLPTNEKLGYGIGAAKRTQDPLWKENQEKSQVNRSHNQSWVKNKREAHKRLENDPQFIAKRQAGIDKRTKNKIGRDKQLEGIARRNAENAEWLKNKNNGTRRSLAKPCITPFGVFATGVEAGEAYNKLRGVTSGKNAVSKHLKKGSEGYKFISIEEYIVLTGKDI